MTGGDLSIAPLQCTRIGLGILSKAESSNVLLASNLRFEVRILFMCGVRPRQVFNVESEPSIVVQYVLAYGQHVLVVLQFFGAHKRDYACEVVIPDATKDPSDNN